MKQCFSCEQMPSNLIPGLAKCVLACESFRTFPFVGWFHVSCSLPARPADMQVHTLILIKVRIEWIKSIITPQLLRPSKHLIPQNAWHRERVPN